MKNNTTNTAPENTVPERETMEFDVVIVGAGPAGLAAAIRLKQKAPELSVVVLEKASEVGAHTLSGAVIDPVGINQLLPAWREDDDHPFQTRVCDDSLKFLTKKRAIKLPKLFMPKMLSNRGNYIVSLGEVCRFLAKKAEELGVEIYPGFAASEVLMDKHGATIGVATGDMGVHEDGTHSQNYMRGMALLAKYTLIGEGARGSLAKKIIHHYELDKNCEPQKYGLGLKELWQVEPQKHRQGLVQHSFGWPLDNQTGGGAFLYHLDNHQVAVGFVVHLNYKNPYISPFEEFQRFKTHPAIQDVFKGGERLSYGARAITEGGWQSVPKLSFPGGVLLGCAAGYINLPRIKGSHNAILSGISAANHVAEAIAKGRSHDELAAVNDEWRSGLIGQDLYQARNVKPLWSRFGSRLGIILSGFDMWCQQLLHFSPFGTMAHGKPDYACLEDAAKHQPIAYPQPDNKVSFDLPSSVFLSNTHHEENQPCHLKIASFAKQKSTELKKFSGPSTRYCPAGVYEWLNSNDGENYIVNAQNCLHCKACDIKDPQQNIDWTCPQGGDGPVYPNM